MTSPKSPSRTHRCAGHPDQFPDAPDHLAWERAVLERAKLRLYTPLERSTKEDMFWRKVGAYEVREISKRRQARSKQSRLERLDGLAEERVERGLRHGLLKADMGSQERLQRRKERFEITRGEELEWITDEERLRMRRARFATEPRDDDLYRQAWASEILGDALTDERRLEARKRRFSGEGVMKSQVGKGGKLIGMDAPVPHDKIEETCPMEKGKDERKAAIDRKGTFSPDSAAHGGIMQGWEQGCESWSNENGIEKSNIVDRDINYLEEPRTLDAAAQGGMVLQEWEKGYESWRDADAVKKGTWVDHDTSNNGEHMAGQNVAHGGIVGLQKWERGYESWGAERVDDMVEVREAVRMDEEHVTGRAELSDDHDGGRVLQIWEMRAEEW